MISFVLYHVDEHLNAQLIEPSVSEIIDFLMVLKTSGGNCHLYDGSVYIEIVGIV